MLKRTQTISIVILMFLGIVNAQEITGPEIVQKVNDILSQESSYVKSKMTIVTSSGELRTFIYDSWSKDNGEKSLIRYLEPRRVKDQAILMLNNADDIWMFFPRTGRVRKLATHAKKQKMQGSDFSYEDMGSGDAFITDFNASRLDDEKIQDTDCYLVEMIKKDDSDLSYSKMMMWVKKDNYMPIVIDYYDEDHPNVHLKRMIQSHIKDIEGIPTAMKVVMHNKTDNTKTEVDVLEAKYNIQLKDSMFTERGLKK